MIDLLFALALMGGHAATSAGGLPAPTTRPQPVKIPPEIAPAIAPYVDCTVKALSRESGYEIGTRQEFLTAHARALESCRKVRAAAVATARNPASKRAALIERTLTAFELALRGADERLNDTVEVDQMARAAARQLPSIQVPYEVMPHLEVYAACYARAFNANPDRNSQDAERLRAANAAAVGSCASTRKTELDAARALIRHKNGCVWRGTTPLKVCIEMAETAFNRFDSDYVIVPAPGTQPESTADE